MILNGFMLRDWFSYSNAHVSEFDCVIAQYTFSTEADIFLKAFPKAAVIERRIGSHTFYVLLRNRFPAGEDHAHRLRPRSPCGPAAAIPVNARAPRLYSSVLRVFATLAVVIGPAEAPSLRLN